MKKTGNYSWKEGKLAEGCRLCVKGQKTVLFITGICNNNCYYCPISDTKRNHDVVYANEWKISNVKELLTEIKLCKSKGVGITGGDPLLKVDRCVSYIKLLKKKFGRKFHIHLYTPLKNVTSEKLENLFNAGLDEIRFHPKFEKKKEWKKIELALKFKWKVGVEIPAVPGKEKEIIELIKYINDKVDFLNLNELEIADNKYSKLTEKGFKTKDELSYGVLGSEKVAFLVSKYSKVPVHYCTCTLKDRIQLMNRIKRRAKSVAKSFDKITKDGTLLRGAIYLEELKPGFGYRRKLEKVDKEIMIKKLQEMRKEIIKKEKINPKKLLVDKNKLRLITGVKEIKKLKVPNRAIVEEMPTQDALEMEVELL